MSDVGEEHEEVFLITQAWVKPGTFEELKAYRIKVLKILEPFSPDFIFYNHPFEWVFDAGEDETPSGIEVCRFQNEQIARAAIAAIESSGIRAEESNVFRKIRSYLSCYSLR